MINTLKTNLDFGYNCWHS